MRKFHSLSSIQGGNSNEWVKLDPATFINSWEPYDTSDVWAPAYKVLGNVVCLKGLVKNGTDVIVIDNGNLPQEITSRYTQHLRSAGYSGTSNDFDSTPLYVSSNAWFEVRQYSTDSLTSISCSYILD